MEIADAQLLEKLRTIPRWRWEPLISLCNGEETLKQVAARELVSPQAISARRLWLERFLGVSLRAKPETRGRKPKHSPADTATAKADLVASVAA
jgi:hypothetical protein